MPETYVNPLIVVDLDLMLVMLVMTLSPMSMALSTTLSDRMGCTLVPILGLTVRTVLSPSSSVISLQQTPVT